MGRRFVNTGVAPFELCAAKDVSSADDDRRLATQLLHVLDLRGDQLDFLHANSALARVRKALAR